MKRSSRRTLVIVLASVTGMGITAVTTPLLTRTLGPSNYGQYAVILSGFSLVVTVTDAGLFDGVRKYLVERDTGNWQSSVFSIYVLLSVVTGLVGIAAIWVLFPLLVGPLAVELSLVLSALLLIRLLFLVLRGLVMALGSEVISEASLVLQRGLYLTGIVVLVEVGMSIESVFFVQLVTEVLATLVLVVSGGRSALSFLPTLDRSLWRRVLRFSAYSGSISILYGTLFNFDILLLNQYVAATTVAEYKIALVILHVVATVPKAVRTSSVQSSSSLWQAGEIQKVEQLLNETINKTIGITLLIIIGLIGVGDTFLPFFFGASYAGSYLPLVVLLPGIVAYSISDPIFGVLKGNDTHRLPFLGAILATIVNVCLNLVLIPRYGMVGAATATSISYFVLFVGNTYSVTRLSVNPLGQIRIRGLLVSGSVSLLTIFTLDTLVTATLVKLVVIPPVVSAIYFIFVPTAIYRDEIDMLTDVANRSRQRF